MFVYSILNIIFNMNITLYFVINEAFCVGCFLQNNQHFFILNFVAIVTFYSLFWIFFIVVARACYLCISFTSTNLFVTYIS